MSEGAGRWFEHRRRVGVQRRREEFNVVSPNSSRSVSQDDLTDLAGRIRTYQQEIERASLTALALVLAAGDLLKAAKVAVPPKKWGHWLRENCLLGLSTARLYMQLAEHRADIEAEASRFPGLSIRTARRLISKPKESKPKPATKGEIMPSVPSLMEAWQSASIEARRTFLEKVDEQELRAALPTSMKNPLVRHALEAAQEFANQEQRKILQSMLKNKRLTRAELQKIEPAGKA
jgi:hypothetical protein